MLNGRSHIEPHENPTPRMRKGIQMLMRLVDRGELAPDALVDTLAWARRMRDDPKVSERVRTRCNELMAKVSADIIARGLDLEKLERLDAGEATDRTETVTVEYPEGRRMWTE